MIKNYDGDMLIVDLTSGDRVEVTVGDNGKSLWVNINGACVLTLAAGMKAPSDSITITDQRVKS